MFTTLSVSYFLFCLHRWSASLEMSTVHEHTPNICLGMGRLNMNDLHTMQEHNIQDTRYKIQEFYFGITD